MSDQSNTPTKRFILASQTETDNGLEFKGPALVSFVGDIKKFEGGRLLNAGAFTQFSEEDAIAGRSTQVEFVFFDGHANHKKKTLQPGDRIWATGPARTNTYKDKDGVEKSVLQVTVRGFKTLSTRASRSARS